MHMSVFDTSNGQNFYVWYEQTLFCIQVDDWYVGLRWGNVYIVRWHNVVSALPVQYALRWHNVAPTRCPYGGPTSKLTLDQRYFTTLAQRSD